MAAGPPDRQPPLAYVGYGVHLVFLAGITRGMYLIYEQEQWINWQDVSQRNSLNWRNESRDLGLRSTYTQGLSV